MYWPVPKPDICTEDLPRAAEASERNGILRATALAAS